MSPKMGDSRFDPLRKLGGPKTRQFSYDVVYGEHGVLRLERLPWSLAPCASR
jgi:hypothetical protein